MREVACNADGTAAEFDLTGILCDNGEYVAGTVIAARAYIENGEDVVYAEQTIERSIAQVASEAVAEGDDHEELLAYIDGALKTENGGSFAVAESSLDLYVGDSKKLTVTIAPAELTAIYASDNGEVVSVSQDGTLTALAEGSANVTVTLGSAVKTVEVSVPCAKSPAMRTAPPRNSTLRASCATTANTLRAR